MDHSCNSGSIQSSSGGGDEEQNSIFLNNSGTIPSQQPHFGTFLDSSQSHQPFSHASPNPNNSLYNLDSLWSKTLVRSNPNLTHFGDNNPQFPSTDHHDGARNDLKKVTKNPKKRARASRKAPTTVLTTDVTNFRQMVQQFTGIPADPFYPVQPFARRSYQSFLNNSNTSGGTIVDALGTTTNNNYQPTFSGNSMGNQILNFQTLLQSQGNQNLGGFQNHGGEEHVGTINGSSSRFQA